MQAGFQKALFNNLKPSTIISKYWNLCNSLTTASSEYSKEFRLALARAARNETAIARKQGFSFMVSGSAVSRAQAKDVGPE
jgi:hypothetical protein